MKRPQHRINDRIFSTTVRIVGDKVESRVCSIQEALQIAKDLGVDLVETSNGNTPAICKLVNYQKFLYEQKQKDKDQKNKTKEVKEIRLSADIGQHDFDFKLKHALNFLKKGHKVRLSLKFQGREIMHKDLGEVTMLKFIQSLEEYGKVEALPKMEGKQMYAYVAPKKKS